MRTTPATHAEADAWITVLREHGHVHSAEPGPEGTWTAPRTPTCGTYAATPRGGPGDYRRDPQHTP